MSLFVNGEGTVRDGDLSQVGEMVIGLAVGGRKPFCCLSCHRNL